MKDPETLEETLVLLAHARARDEVVVYMVKRLEEERDELRTEVDRLRSDVERLRHRDCMAAEVARASLGARP